MPTWCWSTGTACLPGYVGLRKTASGEWESNTGMFYPLDGHGVFNTDQLGVIDGKVSIFTDPAVLQGTAMAGLIMYDEVMQAAFVTNYPVPRVMPPLRSLSIRPAGQMEI